MGVIVLKLGLLWVYLSDVDVTSRYDNLAWLCVDIVLCEKSGNSPPHQHTATRCLIVLGWKYSPAASSGDATREASKVAQLPMHDLLFTHHRRVFQGSGREALELWLCLGCVLRGFRVVCGAQTACSGVGEIPAWPLS